MTYKPKIILDGKEVEKITAFLFHKGGNDDPKRLRANADKSFQGSIVLGMGFTFDDTNPQATPIAEMHRLIAQNPRNAEVIFPYIGGEEVNTSPTHSHYRYTIDFFDREEEECWKNYPELMEIVKTKVKPDRDKQKRDALRIKWWQYAEKRPGLKRAIAGNDRVLVIPRVTSHASFTFLPQKMVYSEMLVVIANASYSTFSILQSRTHEAWARFFSSTLGDGLRYTPSDCFETFPFPPDWENDPTLEAIGKTYYEYRAELMVQNNQGLTATYNRFHDPDECDPHILKLRELHQQMDRAVLNAYGWEDIQPTCEHKSEICQCVTPILNELANYPKRVLVATDCLSEGVNLQEYFSAVLHYDLPWNPNRLEQREGRVDRYGQKSLQVKCGLLAGEDNPIDSVVLKVLIRKAVKIHKSLGITVPVPMDSANVTEAIFNSLFESSAGAVQLSLFESGSQLALLDAEMNRVWEQAEAREKASRTRFAQKAIKPEDVNQELVESDRVLGSSREIERFVKVACNRMNASLIPKTIQKHPCYVLPNIPPQIAPSLSAFLGDRQKLTLSFVSPTPADVEFIGRNHPLVEGLARYLLEDVLSNTNNPIAARCGLTITDAVSKRTTLMLLRLRHLLDSPQHQSLLAEECLVVGFTVA